MQEIVENKVTKERFEYLETSDATEGKSFKFRVTVGKGAFFPVCHVHPSQDEKFTLEKGQLRLKVMGKERFLNPGDELLIKKGTPHQWWNIAEGESVMIIELTPAGNTEEFIKQLAYLAGTGKCDKIGLPSILQTLAWMNKYETYLAGPPVFMQKFAGAILGPVMRLIGYKDYYPEANRAS
jgi:quercetin dioxygenase-like cupin family protein